MVTSKSPKEAVVLDNAFYILSKLHNINLLIIKVNAKYLYKTYRGIKVYNGLKYDRSNIFH